MYTASDLRKGLKVQIDGDPYIVTDFEFSKPGKGQALYRCKMRNMITGNQFVQTYRSNDKFEKPDLEERKMQYLYNQENEYHFMDTDNYEQLFIDQGTARRQSQFPGGQHGGGGPLLRRQGHRRQPAHLSSTWR